MADEALKLIGAIYRIEEEIKGRSRAERLAARRTRSRKANGNVASCGTGPALTGCGAGIAQHYRVMRASLRIARRRSGASLNSPPVIAGGRLPARMPSLPTGSARR